VTERAGREEIDNPIERLRLLREDDQAISSYLDRLDLRGPREREMLAEQQEARVRRDRPDGASPGSSCRSQWGSRRPR